MISNAKIGLNFIVIIIAIVIFVKNVQKKNANLDINLLKLMKKEKMKNSNL